MFQEANPSDHNSRYVYRKGIEETVIDSSVSTLLANTSVVILNAKVVYRSR